MQTVIETRTQEQIVERIKAREENDPLGFEVGEYIDYLDFEHAKPYLKEGCSAEEWEAHRSNVPLPKDAIVDYMKFAFDKAHGERGISANRSLQHMIAWSWLSGDEELNAGIESRYRTEYCGYGLDILRWVCEQLGIDPKEHGDDYCG